MRDPQRSNKATTPFNNYKPSLDTLEDRSLPGNSMLGLTGLSMPFAAAAQKALAAPKAGNTPAKTAAKASATSLTNLSITASSLLAAFSGGKKSTISITPSSATPEIQTSLSSNTGTTKVDTSESWEAILNRMLSSLSTGTTANNLVDSPNIQKANTNSFAIDSGSSASGSALDNGTNPTNPGTPTKSTYDAVTLQRLHDYAEAGSAGYLQAYATAPLQLSATQQAAADALKTQFPKLLYQTNTQFGTPTSIINAAGTLTGPQTGDSVTLARNYLTQIAPFLGVQPSDLNTLAVANSYGETVSTSSAKINYVYLQSTISGIPVYGATTTVVLKGDGSVGLVNNGMIPNLLATVNTTTPTITAAAAAQAVAQNLGLAVTTPIVQRIAPVGAQKKGTVSDGGFAGEDINTELALLPTGLGSTRLTWHVTTTLKNDYMFDFYVDAANGNVLLRNSLTHFDSYRVLPVPAKSPNQGSFAVVTNPADPVASPWGWHDTNGKPGAEYHITSGNNVAARARRDSTLPGSLGYLVPSGGSTNTYNFTANFKNDPSSYQAAAATQLFYSVNTWHDVSYRYGFTEVAGNMQQNNYGRGNLATGSNDAVQAFAQDEADRLPPDNGIDNAFMVTPPDGSKPSIHMFVWDLTGPNRDGDFDGAVVFHELGHGINHRLVNGGGIFGSILSGPQAGAMDEGGADFDGLFYTTGLAQASNYNGATPVGTYVLGNVGGIRRFPYSRNKDINPLTYNDFDPSQVDVQFPLNPPFEPGLSPVDEAHAGGEIWTNTLWEMEANLVDKYGFSSNLATGTGGNNRAYQLYITGLKMTPTFPSMLDGRNAIIAADNMLYGGADLPEIWGAFADRGMGANAFAGVFDLTATNPGWQSSGIIEDFTVPDGLVVTPPPPPVGGDGSNDALYEPNETSNAAFNLGALTGVNTITDLQVKTVAAGKAGDRDWFKFTPTKAGTLTINAAVSPTAGDLDLKVYRSTNGSASNLTEVGIGQGTHRVAGSSETVTIAVGAGITYFFNVQGFNGGKGNYNLTITAPS
ncbi:MAG TPA: M36 family metallopeptidase [Gemmatales bacterium]|nr:M36 family metallopeptidase [Gemmatales bacterium]